MRAFALVAAATVLLGCSDLLSLAPVVDKSAKDYHGVLATGTNKITNIVRARSAPMHYSDLSLINRSFQGSIGLQATFPFGASTHELPSSFSSARSRDTESSSKSVAERSTHQASVKNDPDNDLEVETKDVSAPEVA